MCVCGGGGGGGNHVRLISNVHWSHLHINTSKVRE